jgi:hypothetical protein
MIDAVHNTTYTKEKNFLNLKFISNDKKDCKVSRITKMKNTERVK